MASYLCPPPQTELMSPGTLSYMVSPAEDGPPFFPRWPAGLALCPALCQAARGGRLYLLLLLLHLPRISEHQRCGATYMDQHLPDPLFHIPAPFPVGTPHCRQSRKEETRTPLSSVRGPVSIRSEVFGLRPQILAYFSASRCIVPAPLSDLTCHLSPVSAHLLPILAKLPPEKETAASSALSNSLSHFELALQPRLVWNLQPLSAGMVGVSPRPALSRAFSYFAMAT